MKQPVIPTEKEESRENSRVLNLLSFKNLTGLRNLQTKPDFSLNARNDSKKNRNFVFF